MGLGMSKPQYKVYHDVTKHGDLYITLVKDHGKLTIS